MKVFKCLGLIAAVAMLLFMFGCQKSEETIKIGYIDPL